MASNKPLLLHGWSVIEFLGQGMKMHVEKSPLCCREELSREVSLKYHPKDIAIPSPSFQTPLGRDPSMRGMSDEVDDTQRQADKGMVDVSDTSCPHRGKQNSNKVTIWL